MAKYRVKFGTIYTAAGALETGALIEPSAADLAAFGDKLERVPDPPKPADEPAEDPKKKSK